MELSPISVRLLGSVLERHTGQQLSKARCWRLETALGPVMRRYGIQTLDLLAARATEAGADDIQNAVVEALLNHETSFFRDRATFDLLRGRLLPALAQSRAAERRLRVWSAGCATGQELHSVAMLLAEAASAWDGWAIDLLGTDVSGAAVARARAGSYTQFEVQRGLGITELLRHFEQEEDAWRLKPEIVGRSRFATHSLFAPPPGRFDLILCRNVLLYFGEERRMAAFARLTEALAPGGFLLLGAGETVLGQTEAFLPDPVFKGSYRHAAAQGTGAWPPTRVMPNAA